MMFSRRKKYRNTEIDPDEIFLDAKNLPEFDVHQFEGRIEKPIRKQTILFLGAVFFLIAGILGGKLFYLQVVEGAAFSKLSENNRLRNTPIFTERGVIFDRNGVELAWNEPFDDNAFSKRSYIRKDGFAHILGHVAYPARDRHGYYYRTEHDGIAGLELTYDGLIGGTPGSRLVETDVHGDVISQTLLNPPKDGDNLLLSIDARMQEKLFLFMAELARERGFEGGAGVVMDTETGELLALTSFPEYDPEVVSLGKDSAKIASYVSDPDKPFLNRAISGLYTPGSIVKPFVALAALTEEVITTEKEIVSTGAIAVPNPYFPDLETVFKDWKAHGPVDVKRALAVSSNVYFYEVGGGYEEQEGLGIDRIEQYMRLFGFEQPTGIDLEGEAKGVIPTPEWKGAVFNDEWRLGDTYNTVIGQYGFQVTPLQAARAIAVVANGGKLVEPHLVRAVEQSSTGSEAAVRKAAREAEEVLRVPDEYFKAVREGLYDAVRYGTAQGLFINAVPIAAKTGTAEVGVSKKRVNSWVVGFFPYKNPRYAFAVVMERGPYENTVGALFIMRQLLEWMALETPEYL